MLTPVLYVYNGTGSTVYKLCKVFLCPAFGFSFALDFLSQSVKIKSPCVLVHFNITPILFYISGDLI